jgi:hypothetical protein
MRSVYRKAKLVVVWIDASLDISSSAFHRLQALSDSSVVSDLGDDPAAEDPYWKRV